MVGALKANCRCDCPAVAQHPLFSADITSVTLSPAAPPPPFNPIQPVPALIIWAWLTCFYGSMVIVGLIKIFLKHWSVLVLAVAFLACSASCAIPVVRNFKFDVLCVYFPSDCYVRLLIIISFIISSALLAHKQKEYGLFLFFFSILYRLTVWSQTQWQTLLFIQPMCERPYCLYGVVLWTMVNYGVCFACTMREFTTHLALPVARRPETRDPTQTNTVYDPHSSAPALHCSQSYYGCCSDGHTSARGPQGLGCPSAPAPSPVPTSCIQTRYPPALCYCTAVEVICRTPFFFFFLRSLTWLLTRGLCGIIHDQKLKLLIPTVLALFLFCVSVMAAVKMVWRLLRAPIRKAVRSMWTLHQL